MKTCKALNLHNNKYAELSIGRLHPKQALYRAALLPDCNPIKTYLKAVGSGQHARFHDQTQHFTSFHDTSPGKVVGERPRYFTLRGAQ